MIKPNLDRIRLLVNEEKEFQNFFDQLLRHVVDSTAAKVGLVWDCSEVPYQIVSHIENQRSLNVPIGQTDHTNLLIRTSQQDKCVIIRQREDVDNAIDSNLTIFLKPVHRDHSQKVATELLEVVIQDDSSQETEDQTVAYLNSIAKISASYQWSLSKRQTFDSNITSIESVDEPLPTKISIEQASDYMDVLHSSIDQKSACANIANETRRLLDCDRVSVLNLRNGQHKLISISGQVSINRRSNTTRLLEKLSQNILATGQSFWYPDESDVPPQIAMPLDDYLAISATRSLIVEPIFEKADPEDRDPDSFESNNNRVIGGIVYEHCNHQWTKVSVESAIRFATSHSTNAFRNAYQHKNLFLYPLWHWLGKSKILTAPRILSKTLMALSVLVALSLFLTFWQTDFYVVGEGIIVPVNSRNVFAETDGIVNQISVKQGDAVTKGQLLMSMNSEKLELRRQEAIGQLNNLEKRLTSVRDDRFQTRNTEQTPSQVARANVQSLEAQIESIKNQISILDSMADNLNIRSPIDGKVLSWDLEQRLLDRPTQVGEIMLEVADTAGRWKLELQLDDKKIGHLLQALDDSDSGRLPITFLLAADPSKRLKGEITRIASSTELTADNKQVIKIEAEIDSSNLPVKHAGTGVTAKIICGRSSLGYLWLHDVYEFLNKNVFFRFAS